MPELLLTLKAKQKVDQENRIFLASLQGVDLRDGQDKEETKTFEDVRRKAMGIETSADDVVSLQGAFAAEAGFGVGMGLGYSKE
jgi:hypothetical protein